MTRLTRSSTASTLAICAIFASGCRSETAPEWGYPKLNTILVTLRKTLPKACDGVDPTTCNARLDELHAMEDQAFDQILDHKLLDDQYLEARDSLENAREQRLEAAGRSAPLDPADFSGFRSAVAAELLGHRALLAELEKIRTHPPLGDGFSPV